MSKWIDAEYCEDFFDRWESRVKNADPVTIDVVQNTRTLLRDAPSINIVRCGECKWLDSGKNDSEVWSMCTRHFGKYFDVNADDFCSYGCRKEE